jgi:hypothetical protein
MNPRSFFYFLFLFFFLVACKKKYIEVNETIPCTPTLNPVPSADTILPSDYMPAYPGSHWTLVYNYQNGSDTKTVNANGWIQATSYFPTSLEGCGYFNTKTSYIPSISGGSPLVWGNQILYTFQSPNTPTKPLGITVFSTENIDTTLYLDYQNWGTKKRKIKTYSLASITVNNTTYQDVKMLSIIDWNYGKYGDYIVYGCTYYYAKDVGLVRIYNDFYQTTYNLTDYYIAPH